MSMEQRQAALRLVDRLMAAYSAHDAEAISACFAENGKLREEPWGDVYEGGSAIARHYRQEFEASPDIEAWILGHYSSIDSVGEPSEGPIATEFMIRGTHRGVWRGLPATGARFELRVFSVGRFTPGGDHLVDQRLMYDRASILTQLGVMHDPKTTLGRTLTMLTHPVTMAKAAQQRLSARPSPRA